ncbi:conserved hypothetical protein [Leptospira interrogans serovar Manilae]|uniref:Uncharacterized protein n=7 Tax=Leptospira interrogans TaxID=173 RepID=A0AAQ1NWS9_LEPIR|nr:conserved hypothetical protein [Leptospira interrogans serovar Manilae]
MFILLHLLNVVLIHKKMNLFREHKCFNDPGLILRPIVLVKMDQKANDRGISFDFLVNGFQL